MKALLTDTFINGRIATGIGTTTGRTTDQDQKGARVASRSVGTGAVGTAGIAIGAGAWDGFATTDTVSFRTHLIGFARIVLVAFVIVAAKAQISKVRIEQSSLQGSSSLFLPCRPQRVGFFGIQANALVSGCHKRGPTGAETGTIASLFDSPTSCHVRIRILGIQVAGFVPTIGQIQTHRRQVGFAQIGGGGGSFLTTVNTSNGPMSDRYYSTDKKQR
jgi:hypothetical protein